MLDRISQVQTAVSPSEKSRPEAIVIGAGLGGLAAAIRVAAKGYAVTIIERLDQTGGRARVHEIDGHRFDAGPTIVTVPFLLEELWELCGKDMADDIELKDMSPCYRIVYQDGSHFDCFSDEERMIEEVKRLSPDDVAGYNDFLQESRRCYETGFEQLMGKPFQHFSSMIQSVPGLLQRRAYRSVYGLVSGYVKNEKLRMALSFHPLFIGGNPFRATSLFSLISYLEQRWGVHYAMGGTGSIVKGLTNLAKGQGTRILLNSTVKQILVDDANQAKGVKLEDGRQISADLIVSNADSAWTYKYLLPSRFRKRWTDRKISASDYSMGLFVWYFGTNRRYEDVEHHTIFMGPRYRELLKDIFDRKILAKDFSLYLHRPTKTDPSVALKGCDTFYVLCPVPNLDAGLDWQKEAEPLRQRIAEFLKSTVLPDLDQTLTASKLMTPADFETDYLSYKGAGFSLEPKISQIAWFRPHNISEEVKNLYLVGAGTHPGAGIPGVIASAKVLSNLVPDAPVHMRTDP